MVNLDMFLIGKEGERYQLPMNTKDIFEVLLSRKTKEEGYWKYQLIQGMTVVDSVEKLNYEKMLSYNNFVESGEEVDLTKYNNGTVEEFILKSSGNEVELDFEREGYRIVISLENEIKGVLYLSDSGEEDNVLKLEDRIHKVNTNLYVTDKDFVGDIRERVVYNAYLEYGIDGDTQTLGKGDFYIMKKYNSGGHDYIFSSGGDDTFKVWFYDVTSLIGNLDTNLKKMLINEVKTKA